MKPELVENTRHVPLDRRHGNHQLLRHPALERPSATSARTSRSRDDGLPDGLVTLLLSPCDRAPVATRVMLADDLPVSHDFVIPDRGQGT